MYSFGHGPLPTIAPRLLANVAKLDDEHPSSGAVLGNLEEVDEAHEPRSPSEFRRDIREGDLEDLRHENLAGRERISPSDLHVWPLPQANGDGDLASTNAVAECLDELHGLVCQPKMLVKWLTH